MSTAQIKNSFSANFRRLRGSRTHAEVANGLGCVQSQVARFESGEGMPKPATLEKIAAYFECSVDDLLAPVEQTEDQASDGIDVITLRIPGEYPRVLASKVRTAAQIERAVAELKVALDQFLRDSRVESQPSPAQSINPVSSSVPSDLAKAAADAVSRLESKGSSRKPPVDAPNDGTSSPSPAVSKAAKAPPSPPKQAPVSPEKRDCS